MSSICPLSQNTSAKLSRIYRRGLISTAVQFHKTRFNNFNWSNWRYWYGGRSETILFNYRAPAQLQRLLECAPITEICGGLGTSENFHSEVYLYSYGPWRYGHEFRLERERKRLLDIFDVLSHSSFYRKDCERIFRVRSVNASISYTHMKRYFPKMRELRSESVRIYPTSHMGRTSQYIYASKFLFCNVETSKKKVTLLYDNISKRSTLFEKQSFQQLLYVFHRVCQPWHSTTDAIYYDFYNVSNFEDRYEERIFVVDPMNELYINSFTTNGFDLYANGSTKRTSCPLMTTILNLDNPY